MRINSFFILVLTAFFPALLHATALANAGSFFAGVTYGNLDASAHLSKSGATVSSDIDTRGIVAGYRQLAEWGYDVSLQYTQTYANSSYGNYLRLEGNYLKPFAGAFLFNAGLNALKFTGHRSTDDLNTGFGYQLGVGYLFSDSVGLSLNYVELHSSGTIPAFSTTTGQVVANFDVDYKISGLEAALTYTF